MKKSLLLSIFCNAILMLGFTLTTNGQVTLPHYDGMDYTVGSSLQTQTGWTAVNSGDNLVISSGSLTYTGLKNSLANKVTFNGAGIDAYKSLASQTSGTVYFSFIVKVINVTAATDVNGGYFTGLGQNTTTFGSTIWLKKNGENFNIGINPRTTLAVTGYSSGTYAVNTEVFIVASYTFNGSSGDDVAKLWINPSSTTFGNPSEPAADITITNTSGTDLTGVSSVFIRQDSDAETPFIEMDELRISTTWADVTPADVIAPTATFIPTNSAVDVAVNVTPTITFDEPVRKTNGNALENSDLSNLIVFKKTSSGGADVAFTAAIDASKKVITVTPASVLDNSQVYYLEIKAVEDLSGNDFAGANITFTTIAAAAPSVTLTYPVGGETFYAGDPMTFTWTSANITNVKIEGWVTNLARTWDWTTLIASTPAATGSTGFIVPVDLTYGTQYKIRISDASNAAVNSVSGNFTCIPVATSLADLRARCILDDIVKLSSDVTMTFKRTTGNQKYVQDATAGLLIYDPSAVLTTTLAIGDNFKNLEGKVAFYGGVYEIIPTKTTVTVTSSGNSVTIPEMSLTDYNTNYLNYESELIKLLDVTFPGADGSAVFATGSNNNLTDGTTTITFRTFATGESDIVGAVIPSGHIKMTCIAGFYTTTSTTVQVYSRTLSDFESLPTAVEKTLSNDEFKMYPVPASSVLNISNVPNLKSIEILDVTGKVIRTINTGTDELIQVPVTSLRRGMYLIRLNTADGKVVKRFVKS